MSGEKLAGERPGVYGLVRSAGSTTPVRWACVRESAGDGEGGESGGKNNGSFATVGVLALGGTLGFGTPVGFLAFTRDRVGASNKIRENRQARRWETYQRRQEVPERRNETPGRQEARSLMKLVALSSASTPSDAASRPAVLREGAARFRC